MEFGGSGEIEGMHSDKPIGPLAPSEGDAAVNGRRQDEPIVVIGVLAYEVHAAGGAHYHLRRRAADCVEVSFDHWVSRLTSKQ